MISSPGYPYIFIPLACEACEGRCCNGDSGNIWVNAQEIKDIAHELKMDIPTFINRYLRKMSYKFSIKELKSNENYACVFYDDEMNVCKIYNVRPQQCRTFPFWPYYRTRPLELMEECPGVILLEKSL